MCIVEVNPGGFYHALDSVLESLDRVQSSFVHSMGFSIEEAFLEHNVAPLAARRDIGMLGLIYKCVHGIAHRDLQELFSRSPPASHSYKTKFQKHRHSLQLVESRPGTHNALLRRSLVGLVRVWNRLPEAVVRANTVSAMQKLLTSMLRVVCRQGGEKWQEMFSPRLVILKEAPFFEQILVKAH